MTSGGPDYEQRRANPQLGLLSVDSNYTSNGVWSLGLSSLRPLIISRGTNVPGRYLEMHFRGRFIGLLYQSDTNKGIAEIAIDGEAYDDIDNYSAVAEYGKIAVIAKNLSRGDHTIRVTVSSDKNPASSDYWVHVEGLIVQASENAVLTQRVAVPLITPVWTGSKFENLIAYDETLDPDNIPAIGLVGWDGSTPYRILVDTSGRLIIGSQSQALVQRATTYDLIVQLRHAGVEIDPRAVTIQSQANPFTNDINVNDDAVQTLLGGGLPAALDGVSLKVKEQSPISGYATSAKQDSIISNIDELEGLLAGGLPAALDTGALKVREQNPLTSIDVGNWPSDYPDSAVETLLGGGLPSALTSDKLKVRASEIETLIGEVQASPTANTVLARLKDIDGHVDGLETDLGTVAGDTTSIDGKIPSDPAKESGKLTQIDTVLDNIYAKINDLEDALNSVGTDALRVLGKTGDPLIGIESVVADGVSVTASGGGETVSGNAVPTGKIQVITQIAAANLTRAPTLMTYYVVHDGSSYEIETLTVTFAADTFHPWSGHVYLDAADYISVYIGGTIAGDTLRLRYFGHQMDA